ncbi:hypothetical protein FRC19_009301 [Serendipita sp. 401]|nr:hypothetical protein FRC19_009301 [Serendipita sp. 401]
MQDSDQRSPQQGLLLDRYAKARNTLEGSNITLHTCLGSMMPTKLTRSLKSCIEELGTFEKDTGSLLNGYRFSPAALAQSQRLNEALECNTEHFEAQKDMDNGKVTFFSLTIAPSLVPNEYVPVGGDLEANIDNTVGSLSESLHNVRVEHSGLHLLVLQEKYPLLQQTIDHYYWALRALTEAFKESPFKLTHEGAQKALDRYHRAGAAAIALNPQACQKFFAEQDITIKLLDPLSGVEIVEDETWKRAKSSPPRLDLTALNHHSLTPINDTGHPGYTIDVTDTQDPSAIQDVTDAQNVNGMRDGTHSQGANQPQDTIDGPNANNTQDTTDTVNTPRIRHCFSPMERKGAEWIRLQPRSTLSKTVDELCSSIEGSFLEAKTFFNAAETKFTNESEHISQQNLTDAMAIAEKAKDSALNQHLRIAVVGGTSHGKTSLLNELIGEEILYTDGRATTSWPFVIRHDSSAVVPELHISNSHFQPFLEDIANAEIKPSAYMSTIRRKFRKTASDKQKLSMWSLLREQTSTFDEDIEQWESGTYTFPSMTKEVGPINQMNIRIGQLIRIWYLCDLRKDQSFSAEDWPILTVNMRNLSEATKSMRIEFADLPGYGERIVLKEDVIARWEAVIRNSHGVIIVWKAERLELDKDDTLSLMKHIQALTQPNKPTIAIGTHRDQDKGKAWGLKEDLEFFEWIWRDCTKELIKRRTVIVSNVWHLSAPVVIERIKANVPFDYDELAKGAGYTAMAAWMDRANALDMWSSCKPEKLAAWMHTLVENSNFRGAMEKVHLLALSATKRQLKPHLSNALLSFNKVQHSNSTLLYIVRKKNKELEDLARKYNEFAANVIELCSKWWQDRGLFATKNKDDAEERMLQAMPEPQKKFASLITSLIQQPPVKVIGETLEFPDREKAAEFIQKLELGLRDILIEVQLDLVTNIRKHLATVWDDRVLDLKRYFMPVDTESGNDSLRETIGNSITKHVSLSTSSIEDILSRLLCKETASTQRGLKSTDLPFLRARSQAEHVYRGKEGPRDRLAIVQYITGFKMDSLTRLGSLSEGIIGENSSGKIPDDELRPPSNDIGADLLNIVGVLLRPTILTTPPNLDLYPWYFLNGTDAEDSIKITQGEIMETYLAETIEEWHQILKNEWIDSIDGVVDLCSALGLSIVTDDLSTHRAHLKKLEAENMPVDQLQCLVLAQANCCALVGAFEEVLKECARDDLDP